MSILSEKPAWKQRAIERSTKAAKLRAEQRVERFLDAAQAIIMEKGTTDFAPQLLLAHPAEVKVAHAPLLTLFSELMADAEAAGQLRPSVVPRRAAALTIQTVMFIAQSSGVPEDEGAYPVTAEEVWDFCASGFARHSGREFHSSLRRMWWPGSCSP